MHSSAWLSGMPYRSKDSIILRVACERIIGDSAIEVPLTCIYRNPDLQTGEYGREFDADDEDAAQAWAAPYKGCTVLVHVDPRDPTRSVLRKEEL
jgi:hypothetical protein